MTALIDEYRAGYDFLFEGISPDDLAAFVSVACRVMDRIRSIEC
jgi:hypothetical protein